MDDSSPDSETHVGEYILGTESSAYTVCLNYCWLRRHDEFSIDFGPNAYEGA